MVYLKTTPYTNASACLINILEILNKNYKGSQEEEFKIWLKTSLLPTRASSIYGLAIIAKQEGLNPKIFVEGEDFDFPDYRFYRYKKSDIEYAQISSEIYKEKCKEKNIPIHVTQVSLEKIKDLLKTNYLMVRINTKQIRDLKKNSSNYIVFESYKNKLFTIIDPTKGRLEVNEDTIYESYISLETKKHRLHKILCIEKK
ncbi:MAG: peptidase C39 family protein [Candidatus Woesearchaeota archaeon]